MPDEFVMDDLAAVELHPADEDVTEEPELEVSEEAPRETVFVTGFPGFVGSRLLECLVRKRPGARFIVLVQPKYEGVAGRMISGIFARHQQHAGKIKMVLGDITEPGLGFPDDSFSVRGKVTEFFHLAAANDLGISEATGQKVNVEGTMHALDLAAQCPRLKRFHYMSTAYVSGWTTGTYREAVLDIGQGFKNPLEKTKMLAEKEVAEKAANLPVTIYRPAIIVGDSGTGEAERFDDAYRPLLFMNKLPSYFFMARAGNGAAELNVVPVDFVVEAVSHLSTLEQPSGRTYHLVDQEPLTVREMLELFALELGKNMVFLRVPGVVMKAALSVGPIESFIRIQPEMVDYFRCPVHFDATNATADLEGSGISCPRLADYVGALVEFARANVGRVRQGGMM